MPIFNHGKNTRVLYSNPSWQGTNILATWNSTSQTITIVSANAPIYEGMIIVSEAFESYITSVSYSLAGATVTIADNISNTVTTPQSVFIAGYGYSSYYMSNYNGYTADLSKYFNNVDVSRAVEATETTTFRTGGTKSYITGLAEGTIALSGMYEGTVQGTDAFFSAVLANQNTSPAAYQYQLPAVVVFPGGEQTAYSGEIPSNLGKDYRCHLASGVNTKYDLKSPVAGVVTADMEVQASGGVWNGIGQYFSLSTSGYVSYTASTTGYDNKTPSDKGGLLVMGITANSSAPVTTYTSTFQGTSHPSLPLVIQDDKTSFIASDAPSLPLTIVPDESTFQASSLPSLPLTITTNVNDVFQYARGGGGNTFLISAGTYSTVNDVIDGIANAVNTDTGQNFGTYLTDTFSAHTIGNDLTGIYITVSGDATGDYIDGDGVIACGFTNPTYPQFSSGNSVFGFFHSGTLTSFVIAPGVYGTISDVASAFTNAENTDQSGQIFAGYLNSTFGSYEIFSPNGGVISFDVPGNFSSDYVDGGGIVSCGFDNPTYGSFTAANNIFQYTHSGSAHNFTIASGTYSTTSSVLAAIAGASSGSQNFGTYLNTTFDSNTIGNNSGGIFVSVSGDFPSDTISGNGAVACGFTDPTYPSVSSSTPQYPFYVLQFADSADGTTWIYRNEYIYSDGQSANTTGVFEITGPIQRYTQMQVITQGTNTNFQGYYGFARY